MAIADEGDSVGKSDGIGGETDCHDNPGTVSVIVDDVDPAELDMTDTGGGLVHRDSGGYDSRAGMMGQLTVSNGILVEVVCGIGMVSGDVVGSGRVECLYCRGC